MGRGRRNRILPKRAPKLSTRRQLVKRLSGSLLKVLFMRGVAATRINERAYFFSDLP